MGSFDAGRAPGTWIASNRQTGQIQSGERLVLDVRGASAEPRESIRPEVVVSFRARMLGIGSSAKAMPGTRVGSEKLSERIMMTVLSVRLLARVAINLVCLGAVFLGQLFHRFLAVPLGLIHDFRVREAQEIDDRTVVCCITFGTPELR